MNVIVLVLCVSSCIWNLNAEEIPKKTDEELRVEGERKLSEQIRAVLEHYKQNDPVGIPGAPVPDPMPIPDLKQSFSVATMNFKNVKVHGLSKFRIKHIRSDLAAMQVNAAMTIDRLIVLGNYTMSTFFSRSQGPFTVNLTNVYVQGLANLAVERDGKLRAQDINMDISFSAISMDFQNMGFMGNLFQGIINSVGSFLFDSIKPFILTEAYTKARREINTYLVKVVGDHNFPNSISPLDMAVSEARAKVRDMGYDPLKINDYNHTAGIINIQVTHTWITGISSFYRVGNITFSMENNTLFVGFNVGTQRLKGDCHWEVLLGGGMLSRAGSASFTAEHFKVQVQISQSMDTRKRPNLDDIQLDLGNIQVRCNGAGTFDYVIEFLVNVLPNLLRYQIMDAIEGPIKTRIQEKFDQIDVEKIIDDKLPQIDTGKSFSFDDIKNFKLQL